MLYLLRQGQTDWNLFHRSNGITETLLNQTGTLQVEEAAKLLRDIYFDVVFSSPQKRTLQTCEIVRNGVITTEDRLREIICGEFEGMEETREMMQAFYNAIQIGENVLVVTHAANIRATALSDTPTRNGSWDWIERI